MNPGPCSMRWRRWGSAGLIIGIWLAIAGRGDPQQSANYAVEAAQQGQGAALSASSNYDATELIDFAASGKTEQASGNYAVGSPLMVRLRSTNGLGDGHGTTIELSWEPADLAGLQGYNIYRGTSPSGPFEQINTAPIMGTSFSNFGLDNGVYYYVIFAIDSEGQPVLWRTLVGSVEGVRAEVWVDFSWTGSQTGDVATPYRTIGNAIPWVVMGGAVKIVGGDTSEAIRIDKPVQLTNATPGTPVRIGAP